MRNISMPRRLDTSHALTFACALWLLLAASAQASPDPQGVLAEPQADGPRSEVPGRDGPYVPTPHDVVEQMLRMADVGSDDLVYDLGSGDGRIVIAAAQRYGARGVGIDVDPVRIEESRANAEQAGVADRVEFIQANVFEADFREATVVTLYMLTRVNVKLKPRLLSELRPGTPVVSHAFGMGNWQPDETWRDGHIRVFLWYVPARVEGTWSLALPGGFDEDLRLELDQTFQFVNGTVYVPGREDASSAEGRITGEQIRLTLEIPADEGGEASMLELEGRISGDKIVGHGGSGEWQARRIGEPERHRAVR
jgi:SAM-dependent methyltransferase